MACDDPSLTGAPEGGRRRTRSANCAAGKAVMRSGGEAGCSSQLLGSCAPENLSNCCALLLDLLLLLLHLARISAAELPPQHLRASILFGFPRLSLRWNHPQAPRIETGSATGEPRCWFVIVSSYFPGDCVEIPWSFALLSLSYLLLRH